VRREGTYLYLSTVVSRYYSAYFSLIAYTQFRTHASAAANLLPCPNAWDTGLFLRGEKLWLGREMNEAGMSGKETVERMPPQFSFLEEICQRVGTVESDFSATV
jgi:hypothetical protein